MDPAEIIAPNGAAWEPWPMRSRADVGFLLGERNAAERIAVRLFRRPLELYEYAGLAGAPDDASVEVGASRGAIYIEMGNPNAAYRAFYYIRRVGHFVILVNDGFHVHLRELRCRGFGLRVFRRQAINAAKLGLRCINTVAGRQRGENGYYTWPRFGFDAALPARIRRTLPTGLETSRSVLELMDSEKGRRWWRDNGETIRATFDLARGSWSRYTLGRYLSTKRNNQRCPKTNIEKPAAVSYCGFR